MEQFTRQPRLVRLQVPEEMEASFAQAGQFRDFAFEFLDVVFAKMTESQGIGFARHRSGKGLGDGDQSDLVPWAAGPVRRLLDPFFDYCQPLAQHLRNSIIVANGFLRRRSPAAQPCRGSCRD